jgi:hypothetical protein
MVSVILQKAAILPWLPAGTPKTLNEEMLKDHFLKYIIGRKYKTRLLPVGVNTLNHFILDLPEEAGEKDLEGNLGDGKEVMTRVLQSIKDMSLLEALNDKELDIGEIAKERLKKVYHLSPGEKVINYDGTVLIEGTHEGTSKKYEVLEDINIGATGDRMKFWMGAVFSPKEEKLKVMSDEYRITKEQFLKNITHPLTLSSLKDNVAHFSLTYKETKKKNKKLLTDIGFENFEYEEFQNDIQERQSENFKIPLTDSLVKMIEASDKEAITKEVNEFLFDKHVPIIYDIFEDFTKISSSVLNPNIVVKSATILFRMPLTLELGEEGEKVRRSHLYLEATIVVISEGIFDVGKVELPSMKREVRTSLQKTIAQQERIDLISFIDSAIDELEVAIEALA